MLISRRTLAVGLAAALLASCSTASVQRVAGTGALNVTEVIVDTTGVPGITGRDLSRSSAALAADIDNAVTQTIAASSNPAGTPAVVSIDVAEVKLANVVSRAAAQTSLIRGTLTVTGEDGSVIVPSQEITGTSAGLRLAGTAGAILTPTVENDYRETLTGFAQTVNKLLFP